jgi:hypothetical protein
MRQSIPLSSPEKQEIASGIIRIHKENNFAVLSNALLQDETLSAEATGCLAYLLSKPNDWQLRRTDIMRRFRCGEKRAQRLLNELKSAGYLVREQYKDERGKWCCTSIIYEKPQQITVGHKRHCGDGTAVSDPHTNTDTNYRNKEQERSKTLSLVKGKSFSSLPFEGQTENNGKEISNTPSPFPPSHSDDGFVRQCTECQKIFFAFEENKRICDLHKEKIA